MMRSFRELYGTGLALCALSALCLVATTGPAESQESVLVVRGDSVVEPSHLFEKYKLALERFPKLEACNDAGFSGDPENFFEGYMYFNSSEEFEVCHFWMFDENRDIYKINQYLSGVEGSRIRDVTLSRSLHGLDGRRLVMSFEPGAHGFPYGGLLARWFQRTQPYAGSVTVDLNANGELHHVFIKFSTK